MMWMFFVCAEPLSSRRNHLRRLPVRLLSSLVKNKVGNDNLPLVRLRKNRHGSAPIDLTIFSASHGGHALLGKNGLGKSRIAQSLLLKNATKQPTDDTDDTILEAPSSIQHVSFESHLALLRAGGTVYKALAEGNLNKAAKFLVVRFGLFPLLHQPVGTLSNGQIKKVLLVRALSLRPKLLILDNAFDGLDVPSREVLKHLVSKTLQGFSADILVQGVNAKATEHTQVLLLTHRAEEIVDEISTFSYFQEQQHADEHSLIATTTTTTTTTLVTARRDEQSASNMLHISLGIPSDDIPVDGAKWLPDFDAIQSWWKRGGDDCHNKQKRQVDPNSSLVVDMKNVSVERNDNVLLQGIHWEIQTGQRWLVGGRNGAGKSTLSRLLARSKDQEHGMQGYLSILEPSRRSVGWVSTELHMSLAHLDWTVRDILTNKYHLQGSVLPDDDEEEEQGHDHDSWRAVCKWLQIDDSLLDRRFDELSQGQQRMVLIAGALGLRPRLLVLDEPCQGLDLSNRQLVLELVDQICRQTDMGLVYITHHLEEKLPSITHALHLQNGQVVFQGLEGEYNPDILDQ